MPDFANWPTWATTVAAVLIVLLAAPAVRWVAGRLIARSIARTQRYVLRRDGADGQPVVDALERMRQTILGRQVTRG
ncbi:hypothetical protein [Micromonospora sp. DT229]|uniref:hypothetical protein n=1 Tax=Micromonospora sp. DT229 TaxID=3393430 RepID=UPI003CE8E3D4